MNLNSYDILSLFKEMESAIRKVLAPKLQDVHFIILDKEIIGAIKESDFAGMFMMRSIQVGDLEGQLIRLRQRGITSAKSSINGSSLKAPGLQAHGGKRNATDLQTVTFNAFSPAITSHQLLKFGPVFRNNSVVLPIQLKGNKVIEPGSSSASRLWNLDQVDDFNFSMILQFDLVQSQVSGAGEPKQAERDMDSQFDDTRSNISASKKSKPNGH